MRRSLELTTVGVALIAMIACGGKQSVASKSAQAYREAVAQGKEVSGGGHGGHHAEATESAANAKTETSHDMAGMKHGSETAMGGMNHEQMDHGSMPAAGHSQMQHGSMAGMNHSAMKHGSMAGMDHRAMQHGSMAGMDHGAMQHGSSGQSHDMSGMQHGSASSMSNMNMDHSQMQHGSTHDMQNMPGMSHGSMAGMQHGEAIPPGGLWGAQAGSLKQSDAVDAPAPSSIREAQKSAADDMSGMNHGSHATSTNATGSKQQVTYTCPMHPEVVSSTPGTCPKCGMLLVRKGSQ